MVLQGTIGCCQSFLFLGSWMFNLDFVSRISDVELGLWNLSNIEIIYVELCALAFPTLILNLKFYLSNLNF